MEFEKEFVTFLQNLDERDFWKDLGFMNEMSIKL
jgi:hypothetical protein